AMRVVSSNQVLRTEKFEQDQNARLADLPTRTTDRPPIAPYPVPHREVGEDCSAEMLDQLDEMLAAARERYADVTEVGTSKYERHAEAIFVPRSIERRESRNGEIAHVHHPQGSLHVHCSPADARIVIERGWGELHPLAVRGIGLPRTYLLLYAPRTQADLESIEKIVDAAISWASR
ncbi:MAG: hypothetical protein ACRDKE_11395, partial [Solirubrobacterales bacterium]